MISRIAAVIAPYLPVRLHREVKELYVSAAILDFATAAVQLFEPVYLWTLGYGLRDIMIFYLLVYVAYFFLLPLGANIARTKGFEHAILYSSPFLILYYISLFSLADHPWLFFIAPIAFAIQKTLYWPGYHADFAQYGQTLEGGREVSNRLAISNVVSIAGPLMGGTILYLGGFQSLFLVIAALILASNIPLFFTREIFLPHHLNYKELYRRIVADTDDRKRFFQAIAWGEELIAFAVWPIFIYLFFTNFFSLGALISASVLVATILLLATGKMADTKSKPGLQNLGTIVTTFSWMVRAFVQAPINVLALDTLSRVGKATITIPYMADVYENSRRAHIMTTVATYELGLVAGKILIATLSIFLFSFIPEGHAQFTAVFLLAGAFTLLYARRKNIL